MPTLIEPARVREHGTNVHRCANPSEIVAACRDVLENGYAKINGACCDSTTAGMVVATWDALSPENRARFDPIYAKWHAAAGERKAFCGMVAFFWKANRPKK